MKPPIVFIHGMFVTPLCWQAWIERFGRAGYEASAPPWPGHDRPVQELRQRHPDPGLGTLRLADVVERFDALVRAMPEAPILVGHSMGGLVVQLLLARGLGTRGVAIDSAPPKGVFAISWPFIKSNWPVVNPFERADRPYLMTLNEFRYAWAHTLSDDELRAAYDQWVVPESRFVGRDSTSDVAKLDFEKKTAPLLMVAGSLDRIIPAALSRKNHAAYSRCPSRTDFHEFAGRTHLLLNQPGWEEVADFVQQWIEKESAASARS